MPLSLEKAAGLVDGFYSYYPENHDRPCHLFLDEVHNVPDWPLLVRRLLDTKDVRLTLTGSSSKMLSSEIATSLRGRSIATEVWPYSLVEWFDARGIVVPTVGSLSQRELDVLTEHLKEYLRYGGFPEILAFDPLTRVRVLQDQHDVVVLRDVVERHGITNIALARYVARTLVRSAGKLLSVHKLYKDLKSQGFKVAKSTLYAYLEHFQDAYLCFAVPLWSDSLRRMQSNPRKIYAVDPGLAAALNPDFSPNWGHLFENLVYLDLRRAGYDVHYYLTKDGREIDFYARDPLGRKRIIQVCFEDNDPQTMERETRALRGAEEELGIEGELITARSYLSGLS